MTIFHFNEDDGDDDTTADIPRASAAPGRNIYGSDGTGPENFDQFELEYLSVLLARTVAEEDLGEH